MDLKFISAGLDTYFPWIVILPKKSPRSNFEFEEQSEYLIKDCYVLAKYSNSC